MLRGSTTTNGGFDEEGNDEGLILPMILLCNDGTSGTKVAAPAAAPRAHAAPHRRQRFTRKHRGQRQVWSVLKATSGSNMGSDKDLIVGNWLITSTLRKPHDTRKVAGTVADLAGQLEAAAHAIVHAMKPSGKTAGYNQQKMCLGQVVSNQACDGQKQRRVRLRLLR
ncbi:hypothetical protein ERJ75_001774600 [Trypanosoma vivax]|nr:hypothetical protein ERJ75_001774600 [Trypanosoma vivax]